MSEQRDDKGLLNERLPDPTAAAADLQEGTPRKRTADHLKRLLSAGLALQLAGEIAACGTRTVPVPEPPKAPPDQKPPPYAVVDPIPAPFIQREAQGFLTLESTPPADITIDGRPTELKTPQQRMPLAPGRHTITLTVPGQKLDQTFTVDITSGETRSEVRDLRKPLR